MQKKKSLEKIYQKLSKSDQQLLQAGQERELRCPLLRLEHAELPGTEFAPLHERRQRHLPTLVSPGGGGPEKRRRSGQSGSATDQLVHRTAQGQRRAPHPDL